MNKLRNKKGVFEFFGLGATIFFFGSFVASTMVYGSLVGWKDKSVLIENCVEDGNSQAYCDAEFATAVDVDRPLDQYVYGGE